LLSSGLQPVRTVLRALAMRQLAEGQTIRKVAGNVGLTPKTVWLTSQRYRQGGLERALYERARPGKKALLDASQRQSRENSGFDPEAEGPILRRLVLCSYLTGGLVAPIRHKYSLAARPSFRTMA
jgi:hypothetical protein